MFSYFLKHIISFVTIPIFFCNIFASFVFAGSLDDIQSTQKEVNSDSYLYRASLLSSNITSIPEKDLSKNTKEIIQSTQKEVNSDSYSYRASLLSSNTTPSPIKNGDNENIEDESLFPQNQDAFQSGITSLTESQDGFQTDDFSNLSPTLIFSGGAVRSFKTNSMVVLGSMKGDFFNHNPLRVSISSGTVIHSANGDIIDPKLIQVGTVSNLTKTLANNYNQKKAHRSVKSNDTSFSHTFEFGIPGKHLLFSKPVELTLRVPNFSDGIIVDLATLHSGDSSFNTSGLATNPTTQCLSNGNATIPASEAIVKNGVIKFYTCGASSFTINPLGGLAGSNDIRFIVGDYGQIQLYYNGLAQIVNGKPHARGSGGPSLYPRLNVGATSVGKGGTAWTSVTTTGSQIGNTYTAKNTMTYVTRGKTYTLVINWYYNAPDKVFTWTYTLTVPARNAANIRFYFGQDCQVGGDNANDVGYYSSGSQMVGVYDNSGNTLSAQRYISGALWSGYYAGPKATVISTMSRNTDYPNTVSATPGDDGYGIDWNFGTTAGTYSSTTEWRMLPYVATNVPDLIPGIGQPQPSPLQVGVDAILPISILNSGNASSSGVHTVVLSYSGTLIYGPITSFTSNGWSCGAYSGTTVTCTKTTAIAPMTNDTLNITVRPTPTASGKTATFKVTLTNASDSNSTNNSAFSNLPVAINSAPTDTVKPIIGSMTPLTGGLLPSGQNVTLSYSYSDTGSQIDQTSATGVLSKWNTGSSLWITQTGALTPIVVNSGSTTFSATTLAYGKYKFDTTIKDNKANTTTGSTIFYVDAIEFQISTDTNDIGVLVPGNNNFSTGEIIVTVKTVGAAFSVTSAESGTLNQIFGGDIINDWNGSSGFGYEQYNGSSYPNTISKMNPNTSLASQGKNINTNGDKNVYTYRIKTGTLISTLQGAGSYATTLNFTINVSY